MVEVVGRSRVVSNRVLELTEFVQQIDLLVRDLYRIVPSVNNIAQENAEGLHRGCP